MMEYYIAKTIYNNNNERLLYLWLAVHENLNYNYNKQNVICQTLDEVYQHIENQEATYYLLNLEDFSGRLKFPPESDSFSVNGKLTGNIQEMELQLENYPNFI